MTERAIRVAVGRWQDRLAELLGSGPAARDRLLASHLRRDAAEAASYWLQLVVAVGIATMGSAPAFRRPRRSRRRRRSPRPSLPRPDASAPRRGAPAAVREA